jgi:hypothetical protein
MAETRTLIDRDEIRDWAAARIGSPAIRSEQPVIGEDNPVLSIVFDQHAYQDQDQGPGRESGLELVEWDEWFKLFEERKLALVVGEDIPGVRENFHEIVAR